MVAYEARWRFFYELSGLGQRHAARNARKRLLRAWERLDRGKYVPGM